jgi:hypothetical protein
MKYAGVAILSLMIVAASSSALADGAATIVYADGGKVQINTTHSSGSTVIVYDKNGKVTNKQSFPAESNAAGRQHLIDKFNKAGASVQVVNY